MRWLQKTKKKKGMKICMEVRKGTDQANSIDQCTYGATKLANKLR